MNKNLVVMETPLEVSRQVQLKTPSLKGDFSELGNHHDFQVQPLLKLSHLNPTKRGFLRPGRCLPFLPSSPWQPMNNGCISNSIVTFQISRSYPLLSMILGGRVFFCFMGLIPCEGLSMLVGISFPISWPFRRRLLVYFGEGMVQQSY